MFAYFSMYDSTDTATFMFLSLRKYMDGACLQSEVGKEGLVS